MYGDYWHGSSSLFKASDIHPHLGCTIHDLRIQNARRARAIKKLGYIVIIVWEFDLYKYGVKEMLEWAIKENTVPRCDRKIT